MNRKNQNKRREFLNNVCPTVALAFMGVTLLEACSSGGDDSDIGGGSNNGGGGNNNGGNDTGYTKNGNDILSILITQVLVIYIVMDGSTYFKKKFYY